jgi:hypothetical protein
MGKAAPLASASGQACKGHAEARARPEPERVAADAMALRYFADASHRVVSYSPCQTAQSSLSRGVSAPGSFSSTSFLLSFLTPDRGDGGAPGGGILSPVAPVTTRHHVCEAWAVPRNRDDASRRSTVTVLGPVPALRLRSCLRLPPVGRPSRRVLASGPEPPGNGFTSRPGTPHPAPPSGSLLENAPHEGILAS